MIIVRLIGGLGNQMFQYAAGRRLAKMHGVPLKLDTGWFDYIPPDDTARRYALGGFDIVEDFADAAEIRALTGESDSKVLNWLRDLLVAYGLFACRRGVVKEKFFSFDDTVLTLQDNSYLIGYWQSDRYFSDVADVLRQEFSVKEPLVGRNFEIADHIRNSCSVSIHVRRGDYITNPEIARFHGNCGLDYYQRCIDELTSIVPNPHYFVFSDDPVWIREHLNIKYPTTYVDHNDSSKAYEDLRLMSFCRHNIIANSSFSWWGAWLNSNPSKLVFAPRRWFNRPDIETKDLFPSTWIRL